MSDGTEGTLACSCVYVSVFLLLLTIPVFGPPFLAGILILIMCFFFGVEGLGGGVWGFLLCTILFTLPHQHLLIIFLSIQPHIGQCCVRATLYMDLVTVQRLEYRVHRKSLDLQHRLLRHGAYL